MAVSFFISNFAIEIRTNKTNRIMENFIVKTVLGTFIIEDFGYKDYDVATNISDSDFYYHIPKGLTEYEIQKYFEDIYNLEN